MAKCLNCEDNAVYIIEKKGHNVQTFCEKDLPWTWKTAKAAEGLKKISDLVVKEEPKVVVKEEPKVEEKPKKETKKEEKKEEPIKEEASDEDREDSN